MHFYMHAYIHTYRETHACLTWTDTHGCLQMCMYAYIHVKYGHECFYLHFKGQQFYYSYPRVFQLNVSCLKAGLLVLVLVLGVVTAALLH